MKGLTFEGSGVEYFKIWIVNIFLTIITVGIYYPWAKVRTRRYFYSNTMLEGRSFEYHATGKRLFAGYVISVILFIAFVFLDVMFPIIVYPLVYMFGIAVPWIIWRSLKFNTFMTSFSNVRMSFGGSVGGAIRLYLTLPMVLITTAYIIFIVLIVTGNALLESVYGLAKLAVILSLSTLVLVGPLLAFAFIIKCRISYVLNGFRFGQSTFRTQLQTLDIAIILLKALAYGLLLGVLTILMTIILAKVTGNYEYLIGVLSSVGKTLAAGAITETTMLIAVILSLSSLLLVQLVYGYFYSRNRAYVYANTSLDTEAYFKSTLGARQYVWVKVSNLFCVLITAGLARPWTHVRFAKLLARNTLVDSKHGFDNYVTQKQSEQSSLGEQIGDAFTVTSGFNI